jgi:hypothetical protein
VSGQGRLITTAGAGRGERFIHGFVADGRVPMGEEIMQDVAL